MTFERGEQNMPGRAQKPKLDLRDLVRDGYAGHSYQEQLLLSIERHLIQMNATLAKVLDAMTRKD